MYYRKLYEDWKKYIRKFTRPPTLNNQNAFFIIAVVEREISVVIPSCPRIMPGRLYACVGGRRILVLQQNMHEHVKVSGRSSSTRHNFET